MEHIRIPLKNLLSVSRIITLYYFDFSPDYRTVGEAHDFWEMVYVDSGKLNLQGGEQKQGNDGSAHVDHPFIYI